MKNITRDNLTDTVKSSFAQIDDERLRHLAPQLHLEAVRVLAVVTFGAWLVDQDAGVTDAVARVE